jgi:cyclic pyranopterin phosphate synthase
MISVMEPLHAKETPAAPLADRFGRTIRYLRLSVTDRCDMKCSYCMPEEGGPNAERAEVCSFEELTRIVAAFRALGVATVRVTGGEPLLRRGVVQLVETIRREVGVDDIALTTNATLLAQNAVALKAAGVRRVTISLDSLDRARFSEITRGGDLNRVLRGIETAVRVGFDEIKTNTVCVRGVNDGELGAICDYAWAHGITPRFIELMPIGAGAALYETSFMSATDAVERLGRRVGRDEGTRASGRGPAWYLDAADGTARKAGFISATSHNFCEGCNRVRVNAKGELRPCLASPNGISIRDLLRSGRSDAEVFAALRAALEGKDVGHHFKERAADLTHLRVSMSGVGG